MNEGPFGDAETLRICNFSTSLFQGNGTIVPCGKFLVEDDSHGLFVVLRCFFARFIFSFEEMHGRCQSRGRVRFRHLFQRRLDRVEDDTLAGPCDVGKESVFDGVVLRFVRRVVAHADFQADSIRQFLQAVFEDMAIGGIAPAAIAEQQQGGGPRIIRPPEVLPPISDAVTGEGAVVVAGAHIEMTVVALEIVQAVWVDDSARQRGKVMVEGFDDRLRVRVARSEEVADQFLLLGVDAGNGIARVLIAVSVLSDDFKWAILLRMVFERAVFQRLAPAQMVLLEQLGHDLDAHAKTARGQFRGPAPQRKIGPQNPFAHRVAGGVGANDLPKGGIEVGKQRHAGFPSAPFFRDRPGERAGSSESSRMPRRMVFSSQSKSCDK